MLSIGSCDYFQFINYLDATLEITSFPLEDKQLALPSDIYSEPLAPIFPFVSAKYQLNIYIHPAWKRNPITWKP